MVCAPTGFSLSTLKSAQSPSDLPPGELEPVAEPGQKLDLETGSLRAYVALQGTQHTKPPVSMSPAGHYQAEQVHLHGFLLSFRRRDARQGGVHMGHLAQPSSLPRLGGARAQDNSWVGLQERPSDWLPCLCCPHPLSSTRLHRSWCPHKSPPGTTPATPSAPLGKPDLLGCQLGRGITDCLQAGRMFYFPALTLPALSLAQVPVSTRTQILTSAQTSLLLTEEPTEVPWGRANRRYALRAGLGAALAELDLGELQLGHLPLPGLGRGT